MPKRIVFAVFSAVCLVATPVLAQQRVGGVDTVSVRYGDLDPSQTGDATALLARLTRAAERACTPADGGRANARLNDSVEACKADALDRVVAALAQPELSRLYAAQRR